MADHGIAGEGGRLSGGKGPRNCHSKWFFMTGPAIFVKGLTRKGRTPTELDKLNDFDEDSGLGEGEAEGKSLIFLRAGKGKLRVTHANALKHNGGRKKNEIYQTNK